MPLGTPQAEEGKALRLDRSREMLHAFEALAGLIDRTVNPPGDNVVALGGAG